MSDVQTLARTIATHMDGGSSDGTRVCVSAWTISRNLGIPWDEQWSAVLVARRELSIAPVPYGPYCR